MFLQHLALLPSPLTSTTECSFCFVSISSFLLELFLHSSPVAYQAPTDLVSLSFSVISFLPFHTVPNLTLEDSGTWLQNIQRIGETDSWRAQIKPCVHKDPGEKRSYSTALMYSFPHLEPVCCSMSSSNFWFLICIQISQEAGKVVWYFHLLKNFKQFVVIHTVKGFGIVNKAKVDVFL